MQCLKNFSRLSNMTTKKVATYVFIDLETSGLPHEEHNRTKITEISLVAVKRSHILTCPKGESPRVKNKLTLCLNPGRMISTESTRITGLCNDLLEKEAYFKDAFDTINNFITTMQSPVCLLAHNGFKFDFPILRAAVDQIGKQLPSDLLCADTILAYHDILKDIELRSSQKEKETTGSDNKDGNSLTVSPSDADKSTTDSPISSSPDETDAPNIWNEMRHINETTPKRCKSSDIPETPHKRRFSSSSDSSSKAKRRLTWQECKGNTMEKIYESLLKKSPYKCHEAESDCMMNLEGAVAINEDFIRWVDENHCAFHDITPMTIGVRLV